MTSGSVPSVSVLLPVRNGMPYLPRAVESILSQTWRDFELIVIDDGSSDDTRAYLDTVTDDRLYVVTSDSAGIAQALNTGLARARGHYVARQDADDWSAPERLERQMTWLEAHPDIDVLATSVMFVDEADQPVDSSWTRTIHQQWDAALTPEAIGALMPLTCCIFHATVVARTSTLLEAGGYDQAMAPAEDYDLWLRLLPQHRFARLPERVYTVRVHAASSSAVARSDQTARVITAKLRFLRRQIPDLPRPCRLVLPCDNRGAELFRKIAPLEGYVAPLDGHSWSATDADVIAVTDFSAVPRYAAALAAHPDYVQFGNMFVRRRPRAA